MRKKLMLLNTVLGIILCVMTAMCIAFINCEEKKTAVTQTMGTDQMETPHETLGKQGIDEAKEIGEQETIEQPAQDTTDPRQETIEKTQGTDNTDPAVETQAMIHETHGNEGALPEDMTDKG